MAESRESADRIVEWLADTLESGGTFVQEQAPEVVQELIAWNLVAYTVSAVLLWVAVVALMGAAVVLFRKWPIWDDELGLAMVAPLVVGLLLSGFAIENTYLALKWWVAPKLCVLEWAQGMMP